MAEVIWQAANDDSGQLRFRAGADAEALLDKRAQVGDAAFIADIKELMKE